MATGAITLMYHDVVPAGDPEASGFPGHGAAIYKLTLAEFRAHLEAIRGAAGARPVGLIEGPEQVPSGPALLFTFDDGGASFYSPIADLLEEYGWRGHFFITTGQLDQPGFLRSDQLRLLRKRGHVIGSHSDTHPTRMAACSREQLVQEWRVSVEKLSTALDGEAVPVASVPGGYYSRGVAEAAALCGIRVLFNSEPTQQRAEVDGCIVLGRYAIQSGMPPSECARLAAGDWLPRWKQAGLWSGKKLLKQAGGEAYLRVRKALLKP